MAQATEKTTKATIALVARRNKTNKTVINLCGSHASQVAEKMVSQRGHWW